MPDFDAIMKTTLAAREREIGLLNETILAVNKYAKSLEDTFSKTANERDAALTAKYEDGVALSSRAAEAEARAGTLRYQCDQLQHQLAELLAQQNAIGEITRQRDQLLAQQSYVKQLEENYARLYAEREAALVEKYNQGVEMGSRAAGLEVRLGELIDQRDQYLGRIIGKLSLMEYGPRVDTRNSGGGGGAMYLDLLERALTGLLTEDPDFRSGARDFDPEIRLIGRDKPKSAQTMIGGVRMRNFRHAIETALREGVSGDIIETGVWRGGACIYARAILRVEGVTDRKVWVADSFMGLPLPDANKYPADAGDIHHTYQELAIPLDEVKANFTLYGLLDSQVEFLPGWFEDTLPKAPIEKLAVLRLDGDMYSSTMQALDALYDKVSEGGFVIIDDYFLAGCKQAVHDFRDRRKITSKIIDIDGAASMWRRSLAEEEQIALEASGVGEAGPG